MPYPTKKQVQKQFEYDPATGIFRHLNPKRPSLKGKRAGKTCADGYTRLRVGPKTYQASWIAWIYVMGKKPKKQIDHINGVRHDDRFANLRESTHSQNCANKINFWKKNKHGFRGVKANHPNRFCATVTAKQREYYLGTYDTAEEAARAYDAGAKKHFGEFARLNFPNKPRRDWLIV